LGIFIRNIIHILAIDLSGAGAYGTDWSKNWANEPWPGKQPDLISQQYQSPAMARTRNNSILCAVRHVRNGFGVDKVFIGLTASI
jgi:hypothetical protein